MDFQNNIGYTPNTIRQKLEAQERSGIVEKTLVKGKLEYGRIGNWGGIW